jgi:acylphosphatase
LGLSGWVQNTEDGEVEAVVMGDERQLDALRVALYRGPRGCRVDHIEEHFLADAEGARLGPFKIEGAW